MAKLFLLFTVVPLVELYLLIGLGRRVGVGPTIAMVLLTGLLGAFLARREGARVLRDYQRSLSEGRLPEEGVLSGVLVLVGGALLVAPGVLTDVVGILLLVPPTRRWIARIVRRRLELGIQRGTVRVSVFGRGRPVRPSPRPDAAPPGPRVVRPRAEDISDAEIVDERGPARLD